MARRRFRPRQPIGEPLPVGRSFSDSDLGSESGSSGGRGSDVASTRSVPRRESTNPTDFYGPIVGVRGVPVAVTSYPRARRVVPGQPGRGPFPSYKPPLSLFEKAVRARRLLSQASNPVRYVKYCVQRKVRKGVLHALGIAGKRGLRGKGGHYQRRESSAWRC